MVVGKLPAPVGFGFSFEEAESWAWRERKGRWVVKKGRRQGALAQTIQAASSISLDRVRVRVGGFFEKKKEVRNKESLNTLTTRLQYSATCM